MGAKIEAKSRGFGEFSKGFSVWFSHHVYFGGKKKGSPLRFMLNVEYLEQQAKPQLVHDIYIYMFFGVSLKKCACFVSCLAASFTGKTPQIFWAFDWFL